MRFLTRIGVMMAASYFAASPVHAELFHRETFDNFRAVSLAYDAEVCGVWVANEGPEILLMTTFGKEIRRFDTGMSSVRSLTVEEGGLLLANGWGSFRRMDREGRPIDEPFNLSATLVDTEGLHRDADGSFLVVEDDPSRLLRIAPDGAVLMELSGDRFEPPMVEPQGVTRDPFSGNILVVDDNEGLNSLFELAPDGRVLSVTPLSAYGLDAEGWRYSRRLARCLWGLTGAGRWRFSIGCRARLPLRRRWTGARIARFLEGRWVYTHPTTFGRRMRIHDERMVQQLPFISCRR